MRLVQRQRERATRSPWRWVFVLGSLAVHVLILAALHAVAPAFLAHQTPASSPPIALVVLPPEAETEDVQEEPEPEYRGQIVEISPPKKEETPDDPDYLAEHENRTDEESRTLKYEVNPDVLSRQYSREQSAERQDVIDLNAEKESTGATVGNRRFDPDRDGALAALPSPWSQTNKIGPDSPIPSSQVTAALAGAPQNDRLREQVGERVDLNSARYPYAGYIERIKRQVNFWHKQNLNNLPASVRIAKPRYTTSVDVVLDSDGALEIIDVVAESGSAPIDDCLVRAFKMAGPFPNPPVGLIKKDGRVYLPKVTFDVVTTTARARYEGVDPRAGVLFPGILRGGGGR